MIRIKRDGHVHSPFCPHGTKDKMTSYIEQAVAQGIEEMTFTEHMPLPEGVLSPALQQESALAPGMVRPYFKEIDLMKAKYKDKIKINKGFEVDYIEGYEKEIKKILNDYGKELEDGLLSVHILKINGEYYCIDRDADEFGEIITLTGSIEKLYDKYFETLLMAVKADLGPYKPKRIGHPTLVRIFNVRYPFDYKNETLLETLVKEMKLRNYQIDCNTAGLRKPLCREIYPSGLFMQLIKKHNIEIIYGSDAHASVDVGSAFSNIS